MRHRTLLLTLALVASLFAIAPSAHAEPPECSDSIDNDSDGYTDYPDDPGCFSADDNDETAHSTPSIAYITIRYDRMHGRFLGHLHEDLPRGCRADRLVRLKRVRVGDDKLIGSDHTDGDYRWVIRKDEARGRYYAVAPRRERTRRDGTSVICTRLRSVTIRTN